MNMQHVNGNHFVLIKARIGELNQVIHDAQLKIDSAKISYWEWKKTHKKHRISLAEYDALYPTAPVDSDFVEINNEIATLQVEVDALIVARGVWAGGWASLPQKTKIQDLKTAKAQKIADYQNGRKNLGRALTDEEFEQLHPAPIDADFITEKALIDDSSAEIIKLHAFLKSGPWPDAGLHDVDLLSGTAISYP